MTATMPVSTSTAADVWARRDVRWRVDDMLWHPDIRARHDWDLLTIHGFARLVQGLDDQPRPDRDALFDAAEHDLARVFGGTPDNPSLLALQPIVHEHDLPPALLQRVIHAHRYDHPAELIWCRDDLRVIWSRTTEPLAALILHLFGAPSAQRLALLERIFTAFRIVEHLQDLVGRVVRDRILLPRMDMHQFGCYELDFHSPHTPPQVHRLIRYEANYAVSLLDEGERLLHQLTGHARIAVARYLTRSRAATDVLLGMDARPVMAR